MKNGELTRWFSFSIFAFYGCFFVRKGAPSRRTLRYNIYHQMKFAGAVCSCQANELRDTGMSRLRRRNRMCSSRVSGTAYRQGNGSTLCSPTEEKILCRSPFRSGLVSPIFAVPSKGKRKIHKKGGNRRLLPSCAPLGRRIPARRQRTFRRLVSGIRNGHFL